MNFTSTKTSLLNKIPCYPVSELSAARFSPLLKAVIGWLSLWLTLPEGFSLPWRIARQESGYNAFALQASLLALAWKNRKVALFDFYEHLTQATHKKQCFSESKAKSSKRKPYDSYRRFVDSNFAALDPVFGRTKKPYEAEVSHF